MTLVLDGGLAVASASNQTRIIIEGSATQSVYAAVLATVTFINTDDEPTPRLMSINRIVQFEVFDEFFYDTSIANITLIPINDSPFINVSDVTFNETTRNPVYLFPPDVSIDDSDDDVIIGAEITIMSPFDSMDNLSIPDMPGLTITRRTDTDPQPDPSVCSPAVNEYTIRRINIGGTVNKTEYNYALSNITFSNDCPGLLLTPRHIIIVINDERMGFRTTNMHVNIAAVDDPPYCFFGTWPVSNSFVYNSLRAESRDRTKRNVVQC